MKLVSDKERIKALEECLEVAREAIADAICCEDGLDGGTGEVVIKWCTDLLGDRKEFEENHNDIKVFDSGEVLNKALNNYIPKEQIKAKREEIELLVITPLTFASHGNVLCGEVARKGRQLTDQIIALFEEGK